MSDSEIERGRRIVESGEHQPHNSHDPYVDIPPPDQPPDGDEIPSDSTSTVVDGAAFIFDQPLDVPAVCGQGSQVLWADGEAFMIAGGQGLGKTTLAGQLIRGLLGLLAAVLGPPVNSGLLADGKTILYLAMDRPRQIARSLARQFSLDERPAVQGRLVVWPGPPPGDLAAQPTLLVGLAQQHNAAVVIIDSLKDAALRLSTDEVGAAYNRARQHLLQAGVQLLELHHTIKRGPQGAAPITVADIYGSTWLTSGAGSVVLLTGEPGDPIIGFRHVKQPAAEIGPYRLFHDQLAGTLTIEHSVDLLELVRAGGVDGLTAKAAAAAVTDKASPSRADIEKARYRLDQLAVKGLLTCVDGDRGRGRSAAWFLAVEQSDTNQESNKTAGQRNQTLFDPNQRQDEIREIRQTTESPAQPNQDSHQTIQNTGNQEHPPPSLEGGCSVTAAETEDTARVCPGCERAPARTDSGLCDFCTVKSQHQAGGVA